MLISGIQRFSFGHLFIQEVLVFLQKTKTLIVNFEQDCTD